VTEPSRQAGRKRPFKKKHICSYAVFPLGLDEGECPLSVAFEKQLRPGREENVSGDRQSAPGCDPHSPALGGSLGGFLMSDFSLLQKFSDPVHAFDLLSADKTTHLNHCPHPDVADNPPPPTVCDCTHQSCEIIQVPPVRINTVLVHSAVIKILPER